MFTLHAVSISAGSKASPYHLVVCKVQFFQHYHLAAATDWTYGSKGRFYPEAGGVADYAVFSDCSPCHAT